MKALLYLIIPLLALTLDAQDIPARTQDYNDLSKNTIILIASGLINKNVFNKLPRAMQKTIKAHKK